jgi:aspartate carbamoyltransferase catalytic subunit
MRHVVYSQQFDRNILQHLFERADQFRKRIEEPSERVALTQLYRGKMLFSVFYEPSTRTRMSFSAAAEHLGMSVVTTENAREFSSAIKGETLEDTIRVLCEYYPDAIALRHYENGAAERAAAVSTVPIINAGDGSGQHPTQALLDLYTIHQALGTIDGLTVTIGGDLANGRTARSLAYLLAKFDNIRIRFIAPPELRMGEDIKEHLNEKAVPFKEQYALEDALSISDVVYWTRVQRERLKPGVAQSSAFVIGREQVAQLKPNAILMHPLPRLDEIPPEIDSDPRAWYFRQAGNGMLIRMALLEWILEKE